MREEDICVTYSGTVAYLYYNLELNYESIQVIKNGECSNNSIANTKLPIFNFENTYYGATAPSGAVYAVNRNYAADSDKLGGVAASDYVLKSASATTTVLGVVYGSTTTEKTAIGYNSSVAGNDATAVGVNAQANGDTSTAIGKLSKANYFGATALGYGAEANHIAAIALGAASTASVAGAAQIGRGTNNNANTLQFLNHQVMDENGQIPASALSNAIGVSMVPYGGQATTLSALGSGGVYRISANGYLRIAYQTTAADNYITMKQVNSSGADMWGALSNGQKSYGSGYPYIYMPVAAGDHIKVEFSSSVKIIQVQLIKVKGI